MSRGAKIQGSDAAGPRFTQQLAGNVWAAQTTYDTSHDPGSASYQQPLSTSQRITDAGALQTTLYGDYTILATAGSDPRRHLAKPLVTTVEVQTPDANQPTGYDNQVQSQKYDQYDSSGRLKYEVVAAARDFGYASTRSPGVGVYSDVGEGDYPAVVYLMPSGLSIGADNNVAESVAWNAADSAYEWADGSTVQIKLEDTSLHNDRGGSGTPVGGDAWELTVSDTGSGASGDLPGLAFDGTPGSLSAIAAAFTAAYQSSTNLGLAVPNWTATGTEYDYSGLNGGPGSVVTQTYAITATITPAGAISSIQHVSSQSQSSYYDATDYSNIGGLWTPNPGAAFGAVKYSFDAAGQETFFAYNPQGQKVLEYTYKQWTAPDGTLVNGWVGKTYVYDGAARLTDTYQATYTDTRTGTPHILPVIAGGPAGIQVDTSVCPLYQGADPLLVQHIDYNTLSQIAVITDQYGGQTRYTYDANGNTIRTINPDGTQTLSVYDALNRVIWATNQYDPNASMPPILTHTVFNQLGQTVETDTFSGGTIQIGSEQAGTGTVGTATIDTTLVNGVVTPVGGTLVSSSKTLYDAAGDAIETISPSGLRTGSIYTPDGKVLDTGPLSSVAPDGGHSVTTYEGVTSNEFSTSDFQVDGATGYTQTLNSQYDPALGLFYTRAVDQNGHQTDTYTDAQGRTVRTVFADGSFTESLYGIGSSTVAFDQEGDAISPPSSWQGIPSGGSEEVDLAQRKAGDAVVPTCKVYDAKGNLVDVYQPAVKDMDPNSATYYPSYGQLVSPHWHYAYDTAGKQTAQVGPTEQSAYQTWVNNGSNPASASGFTFSGYDPNDNQVLQILPDSEMQTWAFDQYQNEVAHKFYSAADHTTAFQTNLGIYDTSAAHGGRLLSVGYYAADVPVGTPATPNQQTTYTYDDNASLPAVEQTNQGNVAEVDDYAMVGGQLQLTDFTHTTYDPITGNKASIATANGTIHYAYDGPTAELVETWTGTSHASPQNDVLYGFDVQGRMASVTQVVLNGVTPPPISGGTRYDADGNPVATTSPTTLYGYDAASNLTSVAQPNGDTTGYTYNSVDEMTDEAVTAMATGQPVFAEHADWQNDALKSDVVDTRYNVGGSVLAQVTFAWTYDNDNRLATEALTVQAGSGTDVPTPYTNTYGYDQDDNRVLKTVDGGASSGGTTIQDTFNGDGQLVEEVASGATAYDTVSGFDSLGNLATQGPAGNPTPDTYVYDLKNNMTSATVGGQTTAYAYDSANVLSAETTGGVTTYSLNDPNNPTGYSKAIQQSATPGGTPTISYVLGLQVEAQSDVTYGTRYLLVDGHGSTRALADTTGAVVAGQTFDYDAYGTTLTNAATAETAWLFGGDGVYDRATGWTYHLARWRDGSTFTQSDTFAGQTSNPATLQKYGYAQNDPVNMTDPTGHFSFLDLLFGTSGEATGEVTADATVETTSIAAKSELEQSVSVFEGVEMGIMNLNFQPANVNPGAAFIVGLTSGLTTEELKFAGVPCSAANAVGAGIMDFGNDYLANGSAAFSFGGLMEAIGAGIVAGLTSGCFEAGTPVLLGNGAEEAINDIRVGQRVATDGGVANSPNGKTAAAAPNATAVNRKTWREVTIDAGDWQVQALEPLNWIRTHHLKAGSAEALADYVDLAEMGAPAGLVGTVESIMACPQIAKGPGRVVLTTVSHLNDDLYDLTLTDAAGDAETVGVTGSHRFYDVASGWTHVHDLHTGETLRGDHGELTVTSVVRAPGAIRVYNLDVEADHVYYVGNLTALVHNSCKHVDGGEANADQVLKGAENWLGAGYRDMGKGRFLSADGLRQFRMGMHELVKSLVAHVHFEQFDVPGGSIIESNWTRLI